MLEIYPNPDHCASFSSSSQAFPSVASFFATSKARYFLLLFFTALLFLLLLVSPTTATRLSFPFSISSTLSASICLAIFRFCVRERVACTLRTSPVGMCFNCTAEEVLFCRRWSALHRRFRRMDGKKPSRVIATYNLLASRPSALQECLCKLILINRRWSIRHLLCPL